jgi:hypothetical protein
LFAYVCPTVSLAVSGEDLVELEGLLEDLAVAVHGVTPNLCENRF